MQDKKYKVFFINKSVIAISQKSYDNILVCLNENTTSSFVEITEKVNDRYIKTLINTDSITLIKEII